MKKYLSIFIILSSILISSPEIIFAQTPSQALATVNIYSSKIISQKDRDFVLSFNISNRVGVQSGIKYSARLLKGTSTVDQFVSPDIFSLGENTSVTKTINYSIPASIPAGKYKLWIESRTESGLPLAVSYLGEITIKASLIKNIEIVSSSCYLNVSDDASSTKFFLNQNLTIATTSVLTLKCSVNNNLSSSVVVKPVFEIRKDTMFGNIIPQSIEVQSSFNIKTDKNDISVVLPQTSIPQRYNVSFSLKSDDGSVASNIVNFNYFVVGEAGTIQNVVFDKTFYVPGDIAKLQIYQTSGINSTSTVSVLITNDSGEVCNTESENDLLKDGSVSMIEIPITRNCINPKASVKLFKNNIDGTKTILDSRDFGVKTNNNVVLPLTKNNPKSLLFYIIIYAVILLLIIIGSVFVYRRKKNASVFTV